MGVAIVTDSVASLPTSVAAEYGITIVPAWVSIGGDRLRDGDLPPAAIVRDLDRATTAGPSPGEFARAVAETATGDGCLIVTVAARFSSTYRAAVLAANASPVPVRVLDSGTVAAAQGLVAIEAARASAAGADLDDVERAARRAATEVRLVAVVREPRQLARTGRLPEVVARAAHRARVRLVLEFADGVVRPLAPRIGGDATEPLLRRWRASRREVVTRRGAATTLDVAAVHAIDEAEAGELLRRVLAETPARVAFIAPFGVSMVAHTGGGVLGLAWRWNG